MSNRTLLPTTIRSIDGVSFPCTPKSIVHSLKQISLDPYEDLNGNLQETYLGDKDVITVTFTYITEEQMLKIKSMLRKRNMVVVHEDWFNPTTTISEIMYHGDLDTSPYWVKANRNETIYNEFTFELISKNTRRTDYN